VGVASLRQPSLQNCLVLLLDLAEHHAHAVSANIRYLTLCREDGATVNNAEANFCAGRQGFLRRYLATEDAEVGGLFASLGFRFHVHHIDAGGKWITAGSRSLNQGFSPNKLVPRRRIDSRMMAV